MLTVHEQGKRKVKQEHVEKVKVRKDGVEVKEGGAPRATSVFIEVVPPTTFTCRSGVLLWGQLNTVMEGISSSRMDTVAGPSKIDCKGATIIQHAFRFKVAAKKGLWKVEPAFIEKNLIGYVCYHEDVDGVDILRRSANTGVSYQNDHKDKDIVYVNRYDWSWQHCPNVELILQTLGIDERDVAARKVDGKTYYYDELVAKRFMLLDSDGYNSLIRALKTGSRLRDTGYLLAESGDPSTAFGIHLVGNGEYENGWMAYKDGILVGFFYDGSDSCLDFDTSKTLRLGDTVVDGLEMQEFYCN